MHMLARVLSVFRLFGLSLLLAISTSSSFAATDGLSPGDISRLQLLKGLLRNLHSDATLAGRSLANDYVLRGNATGLYEMNYAPLKSRITALTGALDMFDDQQLGRDLKADLEPARAFFLAFGDDRQTLRLEAVTQFRQRSNALLTAVAKTIGDKLTAQAGGCGTEVAAGPQQ